MRNDVLAAGGFFAAPPDLSEGLDPNGLYPRGQRMALSLYSLGAADVPRARDMGFNMVGPYFGGGYQSSQASAAIANGLKYAFQFDLPDIDFVGEITTSLDAAYVTNQIRMQMQAVFDNPAFESAVAWWSVDPEELRPWRTLEMEYLDLCTRTIREVEQENGRQPRPVWMYEPNHRTVENLLVTAAYTDLICRGAYMNTRTFSRAWVGWAAGTSVEASASLAHHPVPVAVLEMSANPLDGADFNAETIRRWCRHDAYLSLVTGSKGLLFWSGFRRSGFTAFDLYFDGYGTVAADLSGPLGLDRVFLFGTPRNDIAATILEGPATVHFDALSSGDQVRSSLSVLDLAHGTNRYLVAVNSAESAVTVDFDGFPEMEIVSERLFDGVVSIVWDGGFRHVFAPHEVQVWRFSESLAIPPVAQDYGVGGPWAGHSVGELKDAGWSVNPAADSDDALFVNDGALELWDNTAAGVPVAVYPFGARRHARLEFAAGTLGQQNQQVRLTLRAGTAPLASVFLYNNTTGEFETGAGTTPYNDTVSWFRAARVYSMTWSASENDEPGRVSVSFQGADGTRTEITDHPFAANGVPDNLELTCSFSSGVNKGGRLEYVRVLPNTAPFLRPLPDVTVSAGQTLLVTNRAIDLDLPKQVLRYSVADGPSGVAVHPTTGIFSWRAPILLESAVYPVSIQVLDGGAPRLSEERSFRISVLPAVPPRVEAIRLEGGQARLDVSGSVGPDYILQGSTLVGDWETIETRTPAKVPFTFTDPAAGSFSRRFYRVFLGP